MHIIEARLQVKGETMVVTSEWKGEAPHRALHFSAVIETKDIKLSVSGIIGEQFQSIMDIIEYISQLFTHIVHGKA